MRARIIFGYVSEFLRGVCVLVFFIHVTDFARHLRVQRCADAGLEHSHGVGITCGSLYGLALGISSPATPAQRSDDRYDDDVKSELLMRKDDVCAVHERVAHLILFQFLAGNMLRQLLLPEVKILNMMVSQRRTAS